MRSFEFGEHIIIYMLQIGCIVWLGQLLVDTTLKGAQVLRLEEFELISNLMHLALLLE